jgi:hypothetical protein
MEREGLVVSVAGCPADESARRPPARVDQVDVVLVEGAQWRTPVREETSKQWTCCGLAEVTHREAGHV